MESEWGGSAEHMQSPDEERRAAMLCARWQVHAEHMTRVKAARLSHAKYGRSHVSVTVEKLEDLRMDLLMRILALQEQNGAINEAFAVGYEQDFSVFAEKEALSHDLIATLMQDADAFEKYCRNNLPFSEDCDDLQNDLHRILQGREVLAKLFVTDHDLFSPKHAELLGKVETHCHLNGLRVLTVIAQVDPDEESQEESWEESWETNELVRGEFDRFYQTHGYTRVHENDFACETGANESLAVYSKDTMLMDPLLAIKK